MPTLTATQAMQAPQPLDPLRFPLSGRSLIEASAGTGKTFTIAMLYVRLVLGHEPSAAQPKPLTPPEILVVTFTDAATKELRDRIRARLNEAAACFQVAPDAVKPLDAGKTDLLHALRSEYPPADWPACARRLQLAAEWMDDAAVSTIHGWCNRMLREHAFDSDSLFSQTLETDQGELMAEVVRDYWRTFMAPLDASDAAAVAEWIPGPRALQSQLRNLLALASQLPAAAAPEASLKASRDERAICLARIKAPWHAWPDGMTAVLDHARDQKHFRPANMRKADCDRWTNALREWANDPASEKPSLNSGWSKLTPGGLKEVCAEGAPVPAHPGFVALETLNAELDALPTARAAVLSHAAQWVAERFAAEQARRAQMGFDDLLTRLDAALHGPNGERLAEVIRQQFPVALIDEFQDTDPVQYRIFDAVYRAEAAAAWRALILIGDPKQAIYAFRGADIHTYLAARRSCDGRLHTLAKNFRSSDAMVDATNHCFDVAEARAGEGAFLFRRNGDNPVPFSAVSAQGRADTFVVNGAAPRALTAWWLPPADDGKPTTKTAYLDRIAAGCATEMVRLLNLGQRGDAGFASDNGLQPLRPADIAVLVNNRGEADAIRGALAARNVRSVYLSDRSSVFQSAQAAELQHWLAACADPDDGRLVRTALSTATLGLSWAELDARFGNEIAWEACVLQFRGYHECWRRQGVLPMLRRFLNDFGVPARLLGTHADGRQGVAGGERILTDLLHLAELLQQASAMIDGLHGQIRYLADQRAASDDSDAGSDAVQTRLESDGDLVKVVTIHKSKGLEYPLVFLPFACAHRPAKATDMPLKWHDEHDELRVSLDGESGVLDRVDHERLGEDLRKLYVALTRACHATWIGMAPLDELERTAIGYLVCGGQPLAAGELESRLQTVLGASANIAVVPAPDPGDERFAPRADEACHGAARQSARVVREPWWIASYSSLRTTGQSHREHTVPDTPGEDGFNEASDAERDVDDEQAAQALRDALMSHANASTLHDFPRGSEQGSFLHDLLEWAAAHGFARVADDRDALREVVARRCSVRGWARWIEPLTDWVRQIVSTPFVLTGGHGIEPTSIALSALSTSVGEMEFWFAAQHVDTAVLDRLVCAHTLDGAERPPLEPATLNGMLKGFMDLVFEHEGRYYVADYKSNWLGADDTGYTTEKIRAQMLRSRYELQYVLYLLALHRLLKARLPDYDYDEHVGGAIYLFLRGLNASTQGVYAERPPRELIERLDALFAGTAYIQHPEAEVQ
ncbi:exodeoxyribonuclease V subunit beta [Burkholderia sp. Bp8963]|uniref:exodeoxyribonuclease V subunit beta n=1 Tax=Burkholderia sp. Bp8963 TaxID=2184547 RepID=UPI000F59565A|nr:exodeoxyribonuclease V subunit beta [Burkholderia sp. Bp8963]RQS72044.1 exodeoxyribonuclease V subunit beta [Burkholderia sp. Bp8963]